MLPPIGSLQSPYVCGSQTQNWAILSLLTTMTGPYTHWWACFFADIYPGLRMTIATRWGISTPACAILEGWPALCSKIRRSTTLWRTMILVRLLQPSIYVGTENASRLHTHLEIPTRSTRSNSRVRIYREWYTTRRMLGLSGSTMNRRVSTPHIHVSNPLYYNTTPHSSLPEDHLN